MKSLAPWVSGPFELLIHAEGHLINGDDFDRRIALISFDNAIEVAITTYLTLNPIQRGGRSYERVKVERWLKNYHSKLEFFEEELASRGCTWSVDKAHIIWCHQNRNAQYHGGNSGTPEMALLRLVRQAALWIFSVLYDVPDTEQRVNQEIDRRSALAIPQSNEAYNEAIDSFHDVVIIGEQIYSASEVLFAVDEAAYQTMGAELCESEDEEQSA
jgi:hypothetical protein